MIVEFKTVRASSKEQFEKEQVSEMGGKNFKEFFNTEDYITSLFIEIDNVVDFTVGRTYYNDKMYECIYIRFKDESISPNVLIKGKDFKRILENIRGCKIKTASEILNQLNNENNPTSI
jgi:hypothetical protein